jgi:hypothetical protein
MQMYESANDVDDFVKKVNYGITNENSSVSYENDSALEEFFFDMEESNSEGSEKDQSEEEPGKTTEDTKDLVNEHKDLVDTLESDSHEDDKEEAVKQKKELKDLEKEQDNDGHDDDGDGKDEDGASSEDLDEDKIGEWASGGLELSKEQVQKYLDENPDSDFKDEMENFLSGEDDEDEVVDSKDSKFSQDELKKMAKNAPVQTLKAIAKMKTHTSRQIAIDELKERGEDVSEYEQVI